MVDEDVKGLKMTGNNIVGIIYSNIYDECLSEMTGLRTMAACRLPADTALLTFRFPIW